VRPGHWHLTGVTTIASWNRIGTLAVALGVGLTVAHPTGIALASPEDTEITDVVDGTDVGTEGEPAPAAADTVLTEVGASPARREPAKSTPTGGAADATITADARPPVDDIVTPADAALAFAAKAGVALLAPLAAFGNGTPTAPPMAWTVLAWVRREFDDAVDAVMTEGERANRSDDALVVLTAETLGADAADRTAATTSVPDATESNAHVAVRPSGFGHRRRIRRVDVAEHRR
jgi:hypothetical protein